MKLIITTDTGRLVATFAHAEDVDYIDYSVELDEAFRDAIRAEHGTLPPWLKRRRN